MKRWLSIIGAGALRWLRPDPGDHADLATKFTKSTRVTAIVTFVSSWLIVFVIVVAGSRSRSSFGKQKYRLGVGTSTACSFGSRSVRRGLPYRIYNEDLHIGGRGTQLQAKQLSQSRWELRDIADIGRPGSWSARPTIIE
jgi:hypothetical protein